ncbi:polysaccharide biosynthesis protein [Pseudohongiella acticola]|uniref:Polysaccharide biosynthesis protein n=1 Tax=Pseudohongiella acticola TaxID=1524254 RepID=A0A1E8CH39_9GAMM|nr:oligosaccharide flippase family protein [Pseudohongiella acticola]OFE11754.1 polysaccharide biosynthesis protein [Pseudohongiella acticola]
MIQRNLIANYLGQGWVALMGLAFIPLYIRYLGIEAYGLIGLFAVLQAWLSLLDMGMTPTLNREMARFTGGAHSSESILDLLRSIEVVAITVALLLALGIWAGSDWLASDWLRAETLSADVVAQAFVIMGVVTSLRFVEGIYRSCIIGLQHQVHYNVINSCFATLRGFGALVVVGWISPTIEAFFIWQGVVSLLTLCVLGAFTYRLIPKSVRSGRFSIQALQGISRFAGGMLGITFLTLLLTQIDKILLSKILTLSEYGYYSLAAVVASALYMLTGPITQAWFPRLSELHATDNQAELIRKYHQGAQLVSVLMGSAAIVLIIFSEDVLQLWTQDHLLAERGSILLSILALGNLLNGLMWMPYQTQLAHGWTDLATRINLVSVIFIVPAILWVTPLYGAEGAAWIWVCLNAGYLLIGIHLMYRRILTEEKWRWYRFDILQPLLAATGVASISAWVMPDSLTWQVQLLWLSASSVTTLVASAMSSQYVRAALITKIKLRRKVTRSSSTI